MNIKEKFSKLSNQNKKFIYWAAVFILLDAVLISTQTSHFLATGTCKNYLRPASDLAACTAFEFIKNGWAWFSFTHLLISLPAVLIMVFASEILDLVFAKKDR